MGGRGDAGRGRRGDRGVGGTLGLGGIPCPCFLHPSAFRLHPSAWWSELVSNQPIGLFRPVLIHLSYPNRNIADLSFGLRALAFGLWGFGCELHVVEPQLQRPKTQDLSPFSLVVHFVHDITIIVHVHEQVLSPCSSCFCVMAEHHALELHSQRRLRS